MWKRNTDIFPCEWVGTEHEFETEKELNVGDKIKVIVDSQFIDDKPRRVNQIGTIVDIDTGDEWAYRLEFKDGNGDNWFKRYHLEKLSS